MRHPGFLLVLGFLAGCHGSSPTTEPASQPKESKAAAPYQPKQIEIVFVRHGETVSNATGKYTAAGIDKLTEKGEAQAKAVAEQLKGEKFDLIVVSPSPRAMATLYPTLTANDQSAVVWPELNECCTERGAKRKLPASASLPIGRKVHIPDRFTDRISLDPEDDRNFAPKNYADGLAQIERSVEHLRARLKTIHPASDTIKVLVVGHSLEGSRFLDMLLDRKPIGDIELKNGCLVLVRAPLDGPYKLIKKLSDPLTGSWAH